MQSVQQWWKSAARRRTSRERFGVVRFTFWVFTTALNAVSRFGCAMLGEPGPAPAWQVAQYWRRIGYTVCEKASHADRAVDGDRRRPRARAAAVPCGGAAPASLEPPPP